MSGHVHVYDHDHPSWLCKASNFALEPGLRPGAPRLRFACRGITVAAEACLWRSSRLEFHSCCCVTTWTRQGVTGWSWEACDVRYEHVDEWASSWSAGGGRRDPPRRWNSESPVFQRHRLQRSASLHGGHLRGSHIRSLRPEHGSHRPFGGQPTRRTHPAGPSARCESHATLLGQPCRHDLAWIGEWPKHCSRRKPVYLGPRGSGGP
jgi:hypothetical protein